MSPISSPFQPFAWARSPRDSMYRSKSGCPHLRFRCKRMTCQYFPSIGKPTAPAMQPQEGDVLIDFVGWSDGSVTAPKTFFASSLALNSCELKDAGTETADRADKRRNVEVRALFMAMVTHDR
jgi:hypothetical protein